jgi:hypothetical protein
MKNTDKYTIEPQGDNFVLYYGRTNDHHGYNLATVSNIAFNCDLKHIEKLINLEYDIVDIDYWENDAVLVVGENQYYFQWSDTTREPTIIDALDFMKKECIVRAAR